MKLLLAIVVAIAGATTALAQESVDYLTQVKTVLKQRCAACHGAVKQESGLRLDTGSLIRSGGDSGPAVIAGNPDASLLIQKVTAADPLERMPPEGEPLSVAEVVLLKRWITEGAQSPDDEQPEPDPREHWGFRVPRRPAMPQTEGMKNPIDAFLQHKLNEHGLEARPAAPRHILLRRVYFDLIGLPPTREELHAFLQDHSPRAYEAVVDRMLADPRYGERWGRHWMDVWRYSDWYGRRDVNDVRNSASQIFRWRDWIIHSLNNGKSYDQMLREMLAADELDPENYEAGIATGFLIRNYYSLNANDWMRSTVEHTGKAFLGLTFNCAHCHDHKYDPISQADYFRLRAFFEPMYVRQDRVPGEPDPGLFPDYVYGASGPVQRLGAVRVFDKRLDAPTWFYTGGDERNRVTERGSIAPGLPDFLEAHALQIEPVKLPPRAWYPGLRPEIRATLLAQANADLERSALLLSQAKLREENVAGDLHERLAQAEAAYQKAVAGAASAGQPGALAGKQSLLLDATEGRRIVQNALTNLTMFEDESKIEFQLLILADAHVNFQLARDTVQGLTAGYVAFDQGRIMSYQPGTFNEFQAGSYDIAAGQNRFHVQLRVLAARDLCLLSVRSMVDDRLLVDAVPVALNGWNPVGDPTKAILFDARTKSVAVVDEIIVCGPAQNTTASFDFEQPKYLPGTDAVKTDGWEASFLGVAPAYSVVSATSANLELREFERQVEDARRALRAACLPILAAEADHSAALTELSSLKARIAADEARYGEAPADQVKDLVQSASRRQREARFAKAGSAVLAAELAVAAAALKPADDPQRSSEMQAAMGALATANTNAEAARAELTNQSLDESYSPLTPTYPQESSGRRRALAQWLTSLDNPLTARVAVNHIWLRHFHVPLVATVADFGRNGAQPTHPELLDWLAVEFIESGWDLKHMHRLMVTTEAYQRLSSVGDANQNAIDPENKLLWRMNSQRMEAEVVRDALLYCAGQLDGTMGGIELENRQSLTTNRRSLYYSVHPEGGGKSEFGETFNGPDPLECYRRTTSIVPQQALVLTNSDFVHRLSVAMVNRWAATHDDAVLDPDKQLDEFISQMFEHILSRSPTEAERMVCRKMMAKQQQHASAASSEAASPEEASRKARASLVRVLWNHNDFITVR